MVRQKMRAAFTEVGDDANASTVKVGSPHPLMHRTDRSTTASSSRAR